MSPAGRPPSQGETKQNVLLIRLTASQRSILDTAAEQDGKKTSTWARDELLRLAGEGEAEPAQDDRNDAGREEKPAPRKKRKKPE